MTAEQLKSLFENPYNQKDWLATLREIFAMKVLVKPQVIDTNERNDWNAKAFELGSFETIEGRIVGVYEVQINEKVRLDRNKVGLRNLLKPIYNNDVDAALVVFNQSKKWRFSYVSEIRILNKETGKREKRSTDPKRFTYIFGEGQQCRTAAERFEKIRKQTNLFNEGVKLEDIERAFSVDALTKDFYRELSDWYFRALKEVEFPNDSEKDTKVRNATNTIRLITRLIFVWFLKQKGLVPDALFNKKKVDELINYSDKTGSTYYKAILQNLFFATLNTEMGNDNRKFIDRQYGVQGFYRYYRFFKNPTKFLELTSDIPFLNGGLFENLDKNVGEANEVRIDCFSDRLDNEKRLKVPDTLFFSSKVVDLSEDYGDNKRKSQEVRGIIDILQSYNFTVEENTPFEIEVALDPELLGKAFENLLASYVPETETTARKVTGSFYTPRDVVDFMVDESLKYYLKETLPDDSDEKLNQLFSYTTEPPLFNETEKQKLISALDSAKILDPACGSGAFPMGILHKMVFLLTKLDPDNTQWMQLQRQKALKETEEAFNLGNKEERDERLKDISEAFEDNSDDYGRKLYLIENCIYGVDIQPIAVQIAKLRFFISLICDQEVKREKSNLGVRPLPNLETKFVAANSLIKLEKQLSLMSNDTTLTKLEDQLDKIRHKHFRVRTPKAKINTRKKDLEIRDKIAMRMEELRFPSATAKAVSQWNPYDQNASASYFDMEHMFHIQDGFDIVLGNPPYVSLQRMDGTEALRKANYETFEKTGDLYSLFYEQGINLLKPNGILCYITSNKWINANYGKSTRRFFINKTNPLLLIDFAKVKIFEAATVFVNILLTQKARNRNKLWACSIEGHELPGVELRQYFDLKKFQIEHLDDSIWRISDATSLNLSVKIEEGKTRLRDIQGINFFRGVTTGYNEAFHITSDVRNNLVRKNKKNSEIIYELLRGKDIKRWKYEYNDYHLIFTKLKVDIKRYPEIEEYLREFYADLKPKKNENEKRGRKPGSYQWYEIQDNTAYFEEFAKPKIIWIEISDRANYAYDDSGKFLTNSAYFISGKNLKYILAILNSKVADYYFSQITATIAGGRKRYTKQYVEQIPIPKVSASKKECIERVVDYILVLKEYDTNQEARLACNHFENMLETMVYELYFEEQVKEKGLEIIKHVEKLPSLTKGKEGLNLALEIYNQTFKKDHPIRNSIFYINSIEEVKEIEESLKK